MGRLLFSGRTVVTAEGSYRADVLVESGKKTGLPDLAGKGVASVKIFMACKGTPLYTGHGDFFEALWLSTKRESSC